MLNSSNPEFSQKTLKIKQDDKFFSRLLSKETSVANPSFRVYYGNVSSAVPFTWEIQPGTPKHKLSDNSVPPLTPPPSYYISKKPTKNLHRPRSKILRNLLWRLNLIKRGHVASSSPSSLSSSSWSSSSAMDGHDKSRRCRSMSFGSSFENGKMDCGHVYGGGSPDSVMCFGVKKKKKIACTVVIMKKALLSIVSRRSS